jgi:hypothetical protein
MKKFLFLSLISCAIISTTTYAQGGGGSFTPAAGNSATILQQMKEKTTPLMVEKTGLTKEQADKVIELNFEMRMAAGALKDLTDADRSKKIAELKAAKEKKMSELLTAEQIKAVATFYEEMGKNMTQKIGN